MWRRLFLLAAVLLGILAGFLVAVTSPRVAGNLARRLELWAADAGVELRIERLELDAFPPAIQVEGVTARAASPAMALSLSRARVAIQPWPSTSGALVLEDVLVQGVVGELRLDELLEGGGEDAFPIDIHDAVLRDIDVELHLGSRTIRIERGRAVIAPDSNGKAISLNVDDGSIREGAASQQFNVAARGHLEGSFDSPHLLTIESATLRLPEIEITADGGLDLAGESATDLRLSAAGPLRALGPLLPPEAPSFAGEALVQVLVNGPLATPTVRGELTLRELVVARQPMGDVDLDLTWAGDRLNLESFRITDSAGGTVTGSALVRLDDLHVEVVSRLQQVSLPAVLEKAGLPGAWIRLWASGSAKGEGTAWPFVLRLQTELDVTRFAVLDRSYRDADAETFLEIERAHVSAPVRIDTTTVNIEGASVSFGEPASVLTVDAAMSLDPERGMTLRARGNAVDIAQLGPIAKVPFAGHGELAATIEGPYADPTISGTTSFQDFAIYGVALGESRATLVYDDRVLQVDRLSAQSKQGTVQARGQLDFSGSAPEGRLDAKLEGVQLGALLPAEWIGETAHRALAGRVYGTTALHGPLLHPEGQATLEVRGLQWEDLRLGRGHVDLTLGGGARFAARGRFVTGSGQILAEATYGDDDSLALSANLGGVHLREVLSEEQWLDGEIGGTLSIVGPPGARTGQSRLVIDGLSLGKVVLGKARLEATARGNRLELRGDLASGRAKIDGAIDLDADLAYAVTATYRELDVAQWVALPKDVHISLDGSIFSQGHLTTPSDITADAELSRLDVAWQGLALSLARPMRAAYATGRVRIPELQLAGSELNVNVGGEVGVEGQLALRVAVQGDLGATKGFLPQFEYARGPLSADVSITGPWDAPELTGYFKVAEASLRFPGADRPAEKVAATIHFAGRTLDIAQGSARVGEGSVAFSGEIVLGKDGPASLDLRSRFAKVPMRPYPEMQVVATGELRLEGPSDALNLRGRVQVDSLRYDTNLLSLESLIPNTRAPPLRVPTFQPGEALALRVEVTAPGNVLIAAGILEAELRADLLLTGTTEHLGILGNVTPLWARARYGEHVFTVEQASIDFLGEYDLDIQYALRATTQACDMAITFDVAGTNHTGWSLTPSARDSRGPQIEDIDIYTCLASGVRLDSLAQSSGDVRWGATDLLWEVSGLQTQMKRLLPVDEIRLTSGWSQRSHRTTPRLVVKKALGENVDLLYSGSLLEIDDYNVSLVYRLSDVVTFEGAWESADEVPAGDLGLDLRLRWELQ